jgi:hypothetical protein
MIICFLKKDEQNAILFLSLNTFCLERKRVDHPLRLVVLFTCKVLMASRTWCSVRKFPVSRSDCGKYPNVIRNINCCRRNKIKQKIQRVITGYHIQSITLDIFFLLVSVAILNCYSVFRWNSQTSVDIDITSTERLSSINLSERYLCAYFGITHFIRIRLRYIKKAINWN